MRSSRALSAAVLLFPLAACNCDEGPLTTTDPKPDSGGSHALDSGIKLDAGFLPDAAPPVDAGPPDTGEPEARTLTFDGQPPVRLYFGQRTQLKFILQTVSGVPVSDEIIRLSFTGAVGALSSTSLLTDASGIGLVDFVANSTAGQGLVTAEADYASNVTVAIEVGEDPDASLRIEVDSVTRIPVTLADALVYVGTSSSVPTCAQLLGTSSPPAPSQTASFASLPGSQTFSNLISGSYVTVLATGTGASGVVIGKGCVDGTRLNGGVLTTVHVTLEQLPSNLLGDYDVLFEMDLGSGLPPPYDATVTLITDILSDPAGWAVYQTLVEVDSQLGTFFVQWIPPGGSTLQLATFEEVRTNPGTFNTWRIASGWLDTTLTNLLGQTYVDLTNIGGDIAQVVRQFEVGARYNLSPGGAPGRLAVIESWSALVFHWQTGCPAADEGCARRPLELSGANAHLAPLQATYGATVSHAPLTAPPPGETERFQLALDTHEVNLRYGAVILIVLNDIVFPSLPPSIAGNNLTEVLSNVVACADVATAIANQTSIPAFVIEGICDGAVTAAATAVENRILAFDSVNNPEIIGGSGPLGGGEMILVDVDHNLETELVPELTTYVQWSTQSGSSPVTGEGRRAASDCDSDADCAAGNCVPIPSYLKTQDVEHDCHAPVGAAAGAVGCAVDGDCASSICFDPGTAVRICYSACEGGAACALGVCTADALTVDLDPVLNGLGDAMVSACVP